MVDPLKVTPYTDWLRREGDIELPAGISIFDVADMDFWQGFGESLAAVHAQRERKRLGLEVGTPDPVMERRLDDFMREATQFTFESPENRYNRLVGSYEGSGTAELEYPTVEQKRSPSFWLKAINVGLKTGETVVGKTFDALEWSSDRVENVVGTAGLWLDDKTGYLDLPDGISTWELSSLMFDMAFKSRESQQAILDSVAVDLNMGKSWDEVRAEHDDPLRDMVFKVMLDPLWLVGGLGIAAHSAEAAAKTPGVLRLIKHGLIGGEGAIVKLSRGKNFRLLTELPFGLGRAFRIGSNVIGIPPLEREIGHSTEQYYRLLREAVKTQKAGGAAGLAARLGFRQSRQTQATFAFQAAHLAYSMPLEVASNVTPREFIAVLDAIAHGVPEEMPARLGQIARQEDVVAMGAAVFERMGLKNATDVRAVAKFVKEAAETVGALDDVALTKQLTLEAFNELIPRTQRTAGEMFGTDLSAPTAKLFAAMRYGLNVTLLNRPGFVAINVLENFAKVLWDDPRAGMRFLAGGFIPNRALKLSEKMGLGKEFVARLVGDASTLGAETGVVVGMRKGTKTHPFTVLKNITEGFVWVTANVDYGGRISSFFSAVEKSIHFNARRVIPRPSTRVLDSLGPTRTDTIYATAIEAALTGDESFLALRTAIQEGLPFTSVTPVYRNWLKAQGWADDAVDAFIADGSEFVGSFDGILRVVTPDEFQRGADGMQGELINRIHQGRDALMLEPVGRVRVGGALGEAANFEAMARERSKTIVDDISRFFRANFVPNRKILHGVRKATDEITVLRENVWEHVGRKRAAPVATRKAMDAYEKASRRLLVQMDDEVIRLLRESRPEIIPAWEQISGNLFETEAEINRVLREAIGAAIDAPLTLGGAMETWDDAFTNFYRIINTELRFRKNIMGVVPRSIFRETRRSAMDTPSWFDGKTLQEMEQLRFLQEQATTLTELFENPIKHGDFATFTNEARAELLGWLDEIEPAISDLRAGGLITGRSMANFTMLNYDRHWGFEDPLRWGFPYITWPTRTMHRWSVRFLNAPGRAASLAQLRQMQEDMNVDLPQRLRNNWRVPIPGVGQDILARVMGVEKENIDDAVYFDPIRTMLSPFQFAQEFDSPDKRSTPLGALLDYTGGLGPSLNPLIPRALALTGVGLDRDAWTNDMWFRSTPIPLIGSGAIVGLRAIFGDSVTDEKYSDILLGRELTPDHVFKSVFNISNAKYDPWRIRRAAGSLLNQENEAIRERMKEDGASREEIKLALETNTTEWEKNILDTSGPKWERARKFASTEFGVRNLSSWAFGIPVSAYAEGEKMQQGLDAIQDSAVINGRAVEFYEAYPEYTVWSAARAGIGDDPIEEKRKLSTDAFYFDQGRMREFWQPKVDELDATLAKMEADEEFLRTEHGRFQLSIVRDDFKAAKKAMRDELNALEAAYPFADLRPSLKRLPGDRARTILTDLYFDILGNDFDLKDEGEIHIEQQAAINRFQNALRVEQRPAEWWFNFEVKYLVTDIAFERDIGAHYAAKDYDKGSQLRKERELALEELTDEAAHNVTWAEFQRYLDRNRRPPSAVYAAYLQGKEEFSTYLAILNEGTGLSERERKSAAGIYRDAHPLIDRFYGTEREITLIDVEASARMNEMRSVYYDLEPDTEAQMNYLYRILDEYNEMAERLGLPPVTLQDWMPDFDERDDLYLPGTMPPAQFLDELLQGRYRHLLE